MFLLKVAVGRTIIRSHLVLDQQRSLETQLTLL
jgi:hypothetical protein